MAGQSLVQALRHNLQRALRGGKIEEAGEILARLKREDPLSRETRGLELEMLLASDRLPEAGALAEQLCRLFPDSARILFLAGKTAYRLKQYEAAEWRFRESHRAHPQWQAQYWLGKTLTQAGRFDEAEALLLAAREHSHFAALDLAWLYERKNDLEVALRHCEDFLKQEPGQGYALAQRLRLKARMLEPDALVEEVDALAELGQEVSEALLPEYIEKLFETGQTVRARQEIAARRGRMGMRLGVRLAWICYRARAYDLACGLFLEFLEGQLSNFKYLAALETAARRSEQRRQVDEAYTRLAERAPHLYGRLKNLLRP